MEDLRVYEALLNLPSLVLDGVKVEKRHIEINCHLRGHSRRCTHCAHLCEAVHQRYERKLRDLNMASREVYLLVKVRQFHCTKCGRYFREQLDFADPNKSHTARQEDFMFMVGRKQSYTEAALILNTNPKTVERVVLASCKKSVDLSGRYARVRRLGIDEQSHRKGKKDYLCVLTDLDRGILVDILESRKKEDLIAHFESLGKDFCAQIRDVSCDGWPAYLSVAKTCFPQANIILERFHVTKLLNEGLDQFRKALRKSAPDNVHYRKLKWILYKQYHRLSDQELDQLERAFQEAPHLKELYWTREKFHHILDNNQDPKKALKDLDEWVQEIESKKLTAFDDFLKTLKSTKEYVANYVKNKLSNAVTEGLNNLIRSVRRVAFGMPNFEHLRWRALAISD